MCEDYVTQGQAANPSDGRLVTVIPHHQHYIDSRLESKNLIVEGERNRLLQGILSFYIRGDKWPLCGHYVSLNHQSTNPVWPSGLTRGQSNASACGVNSTLFYFCAKITDVFSQTSLQLGAGLSDRALPEQMRQGDCGGVGGVGCSVASRQELRELLVWSLDLSVSRREAMKVPAPSVHVWPSVCKCCHHSLHGNRGSVLTLFLSAPLLLFYTSGRSHLCPVWSLLVRAQLSPHNNQLTRCASSLNISQMLFLTRWFNLSVKGSCAEQRHQNWVDWIYSTPALFIHWLPISMATMLCLPVWVAGLRHAVSLYLFE